MTTKTPRVSVFLSYYNDEKFLSTAIDAILNQDFQDFELILLNHATTDDCRDIAHSYTDSRIVHIDKDFNYGAGCGCLIKDMLKVARGKYVKFCCADDILHKNCLSTLVNYMDNNPNCDCVCSNMDYINLLGKKINCQPQNFKKYFDNGVVAKLLFQADNCINYPTVMTRTDVLKTLKIDNSFIMFLDVSIWARLICGGYTICMLEDKLVSYRIHNGQTSKIFEQCSFLEKIAFTDIFYDIKNVNIIKNVCDDVEYLKDLTQKDKKYFPFVLALHGLNTNKLSCAISGYLKIHELMNDEKFCRDVEERFGFNIANFRALYKNLPALDCYLNTEFKKLSFGKLLKLMGRKIFRIFTPKFYKNIFLKIKEH